MTTILLAGGFILLVVGVALLVRRITKYDTKGD